MLHFCPLLSNDSQSPKKRNFSLCLSFEFVLKFSFFRLPLTYTLESESFSWSRVRDRHFRLDSLQFRHAGQLSLIRFFEMWLENTGSDDFWSINNLCFQNYWLGFESLDRWKWFEFLENAVETANERNWNEIRDFLVPRDLNRVNFWCKVVSIGQVLRGITLNKGLLYTLRLQELLLDLAWLSVLRVVWLIRPYSGSIVPSPSWYWIDL